MSVRIRLILTNGVPLIRSGRILDVYYEIKIIFILFQKSYRINQKKGTITKKNHNDLLHFQSVIVTYDK